MTSTVRLRCDEPADRAAGASIARRFARQAGLDDARSGEVAVCVAELVSNAVRHAGGGVLELRALHQPRAGVEVVVRDHGPGLPDIDKAVLDGWSKGRMLAADEVRREGLGTGLGSVLRMMDETRIEAPVGGGTTITARRFAR